MRQWQFPLIAIYLKQYYFSQTTCIKTTYVNARRQPVGVGFREAGRAGVLVG